MFALSQPEHSWPIAKPQHRSDLYKFYNQNSIFKRFNASRRHFIAFFLVYSLILRIGLYTKNFFLKNTKVQGSSRLLFKEHKILVRHDEEWRRKINEKRNHASLRGESLSYATSSQIYDSLAASFHSHFNKWNTYICFSCPLVMNSHFYKLALFIKNIANSLLCSSTWILIN